MKKLYLFILLIISLATFASAVNRVVTSTLDDGSTNSLRGAIEAGVPGDSVSFDFPSYPVTITLTNDSRIKLHDYATIINGRDNPRDIIINGNFPMRTNGIFQVNKCLDARISGITISNGAAGRAHNDDGGGGILVYHKSNMLVSNCVFTHCVAFTNLNESSYMSGGAVMFSRPDGDYTSVFVNTIFSGNIASNYGGAVVIKGENTSSHHVEFYNCLFTNNFSIKDGGAVYLTTCSDGLFSNCIFTANSTDNNGGGIAIRDYQPAWKKNVEITDCTFDSNIAAINGGGLYNRKSFTLLNSSFYGNQAEHGAAVYSKAAIAGSFSNRIIQCTFSDNKATKNASAIGIYHANDRLKIYNSTIVTNQATGTASAIYRYKGNLSLYSSIISYNIDDNGYNDVNGTLEDVQFCIYPGAPSGSGNIDAAADVDLVLTNNGGPTKTLMIVEDGNCMNTGSNFLGLVYDQRGFPREINSSIDIGAVEFAIADPPTNASIIINNGALTTIYFTVSLELFADNPTPNKMQISEMSDFSDVNWINYQTHSTWTLSMPYGEKTVYARFSDGGLGISETASNTIHLVPEISVVGSLWSVVGMVLLGYRKYR